MFWTSCAAIALLSATGSAMPHEKTIQNFGPDIPVFHLTESPEASIAQDAMSALDNATPEGIAKRFISSHIAGVDENDVLVQRYYRSNHNGAHHLSLRQKLCGLEITNAFSKINLDATGKILSVSHSFHKPSTLTKASCDGLKWSTDNFDRLALNSASSTDVLMNFDNSMSSAEFDLSKGKLWKNDVPSFPKTRLSPVDAIELFMGYLGHEERLTSIEQEISMFEYSSAQSISEIEFNYKNVPLTVNGEASARLKWIQTENLDLTPVWDLVLDFNDNWYNAQVDANSGDVVGLIDWVAKAAYNVYPLGINDPSIGERKLLVNPHDPVASPYGWNTQGSPNKTLKTFNVTIGNNVFAQENLEGRNQWLHNYRPVADANMTFDYPANYSADPRNYLDAAVTNLFYWNNILHDLFYVYGFDEASGNFQHNNYGRGGKPGDAVIANAQDGSGYNNANFATPPDGRQPRMRMYVWTVTRPWRDGDMEGGIVTHEYSHGVSIRLTGGGDNVNCLGWGESGGMGEGWGDYFATILRTTPNTTHDRIYGMGEYVYGGKGIRRFKYSTNLTVNPSTYGFIRKPEYWEVHAKGEVWAQILYEIFWALVDKHGYDSDWFKLPSFFKEPTFDATFKGPKGKLPNKPPATPLPGNKLALLLVVDGLKLQPCYPTFVDARNAIMLADRMNTHGENVCLLWKAFAKRGLGWNATKGGFEDFTVPTYCRD